MRTHTRFGFHPNITVIALTGGPSAGKSTILAVMKQWLENRGFKVAILSEVATELIGVGFPPQPEHWPKETTFQYHILKYGLDREDRYHEMLEDFRTNKSEVLIVDRGTLDGMAYVSRLQFLELLEEMDINLHALRERYRAVIHLETGAASGNFTRENNPSRSESEKEAVPLDRRTWEAWLGHQHHIRIRAREDFEAKKLEVLKALSRILHMPEPYEIERKWRLDDFSLSKLPPEAAGVEIVQTYLETSDGSEHRVRMRTADGTSSYYETKKYATYLSEKRVEHERQITRREYEELLALADPELSPVRKARYSFLYDNRTLEIDVYHDVPGLIILEVEIPSIDTHVNLPPGWGKEVTRDQDYKNRNIARLLKLGRAGSLVKPRALTQPQA